MNQRASTLPPQPRIPSKHRTGGAAEKVKVHGLLAEFDTPAAIMHAAEKVRQAGYKWWDCHVPFPVHGLDKAMGVRPTILPWLVFFCGATGAILGVLLQWYTNATNFDAWFMTKVTGYQYYISGKPHFSLPANIPVIFELTVLLAAVGCVVLMLLLNGLPRLYHPVFKCDRFMRASDDRFFIVIEAKDPKFARGKTEEFLKSLHPAAVEELED